MLKLLAVYTAENLRKRIHFYHYICFLNHTVPALGEQDENLLVVPTCDKKSSKCKFYNNLVVLFV